MDTIKYMHNLGLAWLWWYRLLLWPTVHVHCLKLRRWKLKDLMALHTISGIKLDQVKSLVTFTPRYLLESTHLVLDHGAYMKSGKPSFFSL